MRKVNPEEISRSIAEQALDLSNEMSRREMDYALELTAETRRRLALVCGATDDELIEVARAFAEWAVDACNLDGFECPAVVE